MSRAQWLAFGSGLAVAGCTAGALPGAADDTIPSVSSSVAEGGADGGAQERGPGTPEDSERALDSGVSCARDAAIADAEAATDGAETPDSAPACSMAPGSTFPCGSNTCDRMTQWCRMSPLGGESGYCTADDAGYTFPLRCQSCPTCECVTAAWDAGGTIGSNGCKCMDLDSGGIGLECLNCYGAPPARLERIG
jgi:hypothetical protein